MSKVLFANTYFYKLDSKQWKFRQPYPPLGTLQAAAVVRELGMSTAVFDVSLTDNPLEIKTALVNEKPTYFILYDDGFNYLTKMCLTIMREAAYKMALLAKRSGCIVIINSSDASDHYEKYFENGVDYVIRGEGEMRLKELLTALDKRTDTSMLSGLAFRKHGRLTVNPSKEVLKKLDELPIPAWDLINLTPYQSLWKKHHGYFSLNIATTRGCPYKCNWCKAYLWQSIQFKITRACCKRD